MKEKKKRRNLAVIHHTKENKKKKKVMEKKRNKTMIGYEGIIQELITKIYNTSINPEEIC